MFSKFLTDVVWDSLRLENPLSSPESSTIWLFIKYSVVYKLKSWSASETETVVFESAYWDRFLDNSFWLALELLKN